MSEQATSDDHVGMIWWNTLTEIERAYWLKRADSARAVDAWCEHKREQQRDTFRAEIAS